MLILLARLLSIIPATAVVASPAAARTGMVSDRWGFAKAFRFAVVLCALLIAASGGGRAQAQSITIDPASAVEAAASSVTMNHTVGSGSNRFLVVSVAIERETDRVTAITYAGQALTFVGTSVDPTNTARIEVWRLIAPATGTNTVSVTFNSSSSVVVAAISFANVDQTNPIAASQFASGTGSSDASVSVASATDQVVLSAIAANDAVNSVTPFAGQTGRWNVLNAADVIGAGSTTAGSSTTTMRFTLQSPQPWTMGAFSIRPSPPPGIVTNTNDSGAGSLREAVTWANTAPSPTTITFAIPGAGPHTIGLLSALPAVTANDLVIDGTTQPGAQCRNLWDGNGHDLRVNVRRSATSSFIGFQLAGARQTIKGLSITRFSDAVRLLAASSGAKVQCNYIGVVPSGGGENNGNVGVAVYGASALIGGLNAGEGNLLASNGVAGITTYSGSTDTSIQGNFIGTDSTGMSALSSGTGISNQSGSVTWRDITYNLIAGNVGGAIGLDADDRVTPSTDLVRIQRNRIGFNRTLSALLLNGNSALRFGTGSIATALIGGNVSTDGNEIAGTVDGIAITTGTNVTIQGNTIARSGGRGIALVNVNGATIGGTSGTQGNVIGGNGTIGIDVSGGSSNITINGNQIGAATITGGTFENQSHGIYLENANGIVIGNGAANGRNLISRNARRGIKAFGINSNVTINGNYIGTDSSGNLALTNGQIEGPSQRDAVIFEIGTFSNIAILNNVVGGYSNALLKFNESTVSNLTVRGNNIGVGANGTAQIVSANTESLIAFGGGTRNYSNVTIGGLNTGEGNVVAFGGQNGMTVNSAQTGITIIGNTVRNNTGNGILIIPATQAAMIANRIFDNGLLGIDLGGNGATPNDAGDGDSGANDLLNFPEAIRAIVNGPNQLGYNFTLDVPAAANGYRVEFFANSAADPSGFGEGERYLGHVDIAHAGGAQSYIGALATLQPVSIGDIISATTTRRTAGGAWDITSEFSAVATADGVAQLAVTINSEVFDPQPENPFATPGNDVLLTTTVSNGGTGSTDADSIFAVIAIDPNHAFRNDVTPGFGGVVGFSTSAPALTFTPGTDLRFSNGTAPPTSLAQCTYSPAPGYDSQVRYVCLNPKGSLRGNPANGQLYVQLRARIN